MFGSIAKKIFGTANDRILRGMQSTVDAINALEENIAKLSDDELKARTDEFRKRLNNGETLDNILPEAFATVREASVRTLGLRPFDVQLMGGITLHNGMISEMRTGEGKTLVATLPAYLNAISGKGVHIITVNDYLAQRDSEWMGKIFNFLGLAVGCIVHDLRDEDRKEAYASDITYGTNNEFGFDYLRDNMKFAREDMAQRAFNFAIVDEVDSILIDEARTPLIISGPVDDRTDLYVAVDKLISQLNAEDYEIDEKARSVTYTEEGTQHVEDLLKANGLMDENSSMYDLNNISLVHHADQALKAHNLFKRDADYIVNENRVIIIDEFTGRMMEGRRFSEGLHQALEAKENVAIQQENQTLASITFQNYFRLYPKLSGMTGTAMTEAAEFAEIYKLEAVEMPTNVAVTRIDHDDEIYRTAEEKYGAIVALIHDCHKKKQPVLVGTISIEKSEELSKVLKKEKIPHKVLNARYHEKEAQIITQAGQPGAITIATNMAGRGTDIQLGGNLDMLLEEKLKGNEPEDKATKIRKEIEEQVARDKKTVLDAGGLCVIGTERHESRRIDNQLRGRSGRQGDPGYTIFFLSLEDDLMRIFGADKKMDFIMRKMGEPGEPITAPILSRVLEKAQTRVEARNFEIRKNLLRFDDVMNDQRKVIFEQRIDLMESEDVSETISDFLQAYTEELVQMHVPEKAYEEDWDVESLEKECFRVFSLHIATQKWAKEEGVANEEIHERILKVASDHLKDKESRAGAENMRLIEKRLLLFTLDELWKDHLLSLDHLRQGINLRAYGQKDPLNEYKKEAFVMFEQMLDHLREVVITRLCHFELQQENQGETLLQQRAAQRMMESRDDKSTQNSSGWPDSIDTVIKNKPTGPFDPANPETWGKVGRNEACPCGSGKKFKQCHGKIV